MRNVANYCNVSPGLSHHVYLLRFTLDLGNFNDFLYLYTVEPYYRAPFRSRVNVSFFSYKGEVEIVGGGMMEDLGWGRGLTDPVLQELLLGCELPVLPSWWAGGCSDAPLYFSMKNTG